MSRERTTDSNENEKIDHFYTFERGTIRIDHENTGKLRKIKKRLGLFLGNVQERSVSIKKNSWMPKVVNWKIPTNKILIKIPKRNFLSVWLKFTRSFYIELGSEIGNSYFTLHVIYYKKIVTLCVFCSFCQILYI